MSNKAANFVSCMRIDAYNYDYKIKNKTNMYSNTYLKNIKE